MKEVYNSYSMCLVKRKDKRIRLGMRWKMSVRLWQDCCTKAICGQCLGGQLLSVSGLSLDFRVYYTPIMKWQ